MQHVDWGPEPPEGEFLKKVMNLRRVQEFRRKKKRKERGEPEPEEEIFTASLRKGWRSGKKKGRCRGRVSTEAKMGGFVEGPNWLKLLGQRERTRKCRRRVRAERNRENRGVSMEAREEKEMGKDSGCVSPVQSVFDLPDGSRMAILCLSKEWDHTEIACKISTGGYVKFPLTAGEVCTWEYFRFKNGEFPCDECKGKEVVIALLPDEKPTYRCMCCASAGEVEADAGDLKFIREKGIKLKYFEVHENPDSSVSFFMMPEGNVKEDMQAAVLQISAQGQQKIAPVQAHAQTQAVTGGGEGKKRGRPKVQDQAAMSGGEGKKRGRPRKDKDKGCETEETGETPDLFGPADVSPVTIPSPSPSSVQEEDKFSLSLPLSSPVPSGKPASSPLPLDALSGKPASSPLPLDVLSGKPPFVATCDGSDFLQILTGDLKKFPDEELIKRLAAVRRKPFDPATEKREDLPVLLAQAVLAKD
jgi:hypothetical protein